MMDPIVDLFAETVSGVTLHRPQKPIVSTVSGTWLTDAEATDPQYWATHLRSTVRFADALDTLLAVEHPLLLEVGPGQSTATLARQQAGTKSIPVLAGLANHQDWPAVCRAILTTLGQLYLNGLEPDWRAFYAGQNRAIIKLPTYSFNRKRCWLDPVLTSGRAYTAAPVLQQNLSTQEPQGIVALPDLLPKTPTRQPGMRKDTLIRKVNQLLEDASGIEMDGVSPDMSFLEIGLDSLLLTQVALTLKKEFGLPITFRQLTNEYVTPDQLADYLDQTLPQTEMPAQGVPVEPRQHPPVYLSVNPAAGLNGWAGQPERLASSSDSALGLIAQQLQLLAKQVALLQGSPAVPILPAVPVVAPVHPANGQATVSPGIDAADLTAEEKVELKKPFGATARIDRQASVLTDKQEMFIQQLTQRYNQKTKASKSYAQQHRAHMADPRVVSGFRPLTKKSFTR